MRARLNQTGYFDMQKLIFSTTIVALMAGPAMAHEVTAGSAPFTVDWSDSVSGGNITGTATFSDFVFSDNGTNWGAPGNAASFTVDSWSDTAITFTVPTPSGTNGEWQVWAGTPASVTVVDNAGDVSDSPELAITPTSNPADY